MSNRNTSTRRPFQIKRNFALKFLLALALMVSNQIAPIYGKPELGEQKPFKHAARIIEFPTTTTLTMLGNLQIVPLKFEAMPDKTEGRMVPAIGRILVQANNFVVFWPNGNFAKNPGLIDKLPVDSFDSIEFTFSSMDDSEEGLADKAVAHFARFTALKKLIMDRTDLTDKGLCTLGKLTNLESLSFFMTTVDGSGLKNLSSLKKLTNLRISNCSFKPENFAYLGNFSALEQLHMARTGPHDRDLGFLLQLKHLQRLNISDNPNLTDACLDTVGKVKTLSSLVLCRDKISAKALEKLKGCSLKTLDLPSDTYTAKEIKQIHSWLPGTAIQFKNSGQKVEKENTDEIKTLFGPLTR